MFQNHLRVALRRFGRQKGYAAINVLGLAVGLAVCGLLLLFVRHETSYEGFHEHAERIHLFVQLPDGGEGSATVSAPARLGPTLAEGLPEVEHAVRVVGVGGSSVRAGSETHYIDEMYRTGVRLYRADAEVFEVFSFPFVAGDPATALVEPATVVLDEVLVRVLFGPASPTDVIGEIVEHGGVTYRVTGVIQRVPAATHWRPSALFSMEPALSDPGSGLSDPMMYMFQTYLLFRVGADPAAVLQKTPGVLASGLGDAHWSHVRFHAQPISRLRLHGYGAGLEATGRGERLHGVNLRQGTRLWIFAGVAALILLLAAVNYVNLATAYGLQRTREVGVRKTLGAQRGQLAAQTLAEAALLAGVAGVIALGLIALALPFFNEAVRTEVAFSPLRDPHLVAAFLGVALGVGLLAGAYPALALSAARPAEAFRGRAPSGLEGGRVRQGLVVSQFTVTIALVASALVMGRQLAFMQSDRLGLEPDQVLVISLHHAPPIAATAAFEDAVRRHPAVLETAFASGVPGGGAGHALFAVPTSDGEPRHVEAWVFSTAPTYTSVLGMEIIAGGPLPAPPSPSPPPILISETAAAAVGWTPEEAVGREYPFPRSSPVAGVVRDFHVQSLREAIMPAILLPIGEDERRSVLLVRFAPAQTKGVLEAARAAWEELVPGEPLRAHVLDEAFAAFYTEERRLAGIFGVFGGLAVLVACLGLFGLAAFTVERRTKEVGVRKVLGASAGSIVALLSRDFLKLVLVALVISAPVAYVAMSRWLEDFAYRITLGPGVFVAAGLVALLVALLTVSYHAFRAAMADPVDTLRAE